jgi:FtsP/CotA-like multicopper oxidase with cupredoxin domain
VSPPLDRRDFLAAGGGGLLLCTLGGQKVFTDREADVASLSQEIEVPPKVRAANGSGAATTASGTAVLAANGGARREYWIRAESRRWNIVPRGRDQMLGKKVRGKTKFTAYGYRAYTQDFATPIGKATVPGPLIEAETGDTIVVNFQNALGSPVTIHPHGVQYSIEMDGAYKGKYTDPGGFVQPGETYQYVWEATPGTEGAWIYHDHGPLDPVPVYKGLFGPLIIREKGAPRPDKEFFVAFHSFQPVATGLNTIFWCINGRAYTGNTPTFRARVGQRVAWHVYALDDAFHTFHIHGHRWKDPNGGKVIDNQTLGPGDSISLEYVEDNPGRWFYHCHVFSHLHQGMTGWYIVN